MGSTDGLSSCGTMGAATGSVPAAGAHHRSRGHEARVLRVLQRQALLSAAAQERRHRQHHVPFLMLQPPSGAEALAHTPAREGAPSEDFREPPFYALG